VPFTFNAYPNPMKIRPSLLLLLAIAAATAPFVQAQDAGDKPALDPESVKLDDDAPGNPGDAAEEPAKDPLGEGAAEEARIIKALPEADQARLRELLRDASSFVSGIRLQEAFEKLLEAEEIAPELFTIHNLKGAVYTKMRDFDKARASFEKAIAIAPEAFMGRFNLAETCFVTDNYEEAIERFESLLPTLEKQAKEAKAAAGNPKKPLDATQRKNLLLQAEATLGTIKLIQFKLLIAKLKTGDQAAADAIQKSFHYLDDAPAFYYGNAALAYHRADEAEGNALAVREAQEEAQQWLRSAEKIYNRQQLEIYTDSLIETGWIDNLQ